MQPRKILRTNIQETSRSAVSSTTLHLGFGKPRVGVLKTPSGNFVCQVQTCPGKSPRMLFYGDDLGLARLHLIPNTMLLPSVTNIQGTPTICASAASLVNESGLTTV